MTHVKPAPRAVAYTRRPIPGVHRQLVNVHTFDAYAPDEIARLVDAVGVRKAALPVLQTLTLAVLAGFFIAFGAMLFTLVMSGESGLGFGLHRWLGGIAFALGLVLVVIAGAELFTGNNLIVMAWADRKIGSAALLRNWTLVYAGNFAGSLAAAVLVLQSGTLGLGSGAVEATAVAIAVGKLALGWSEAFVRGILCNLLVCLAVWISFASRRVSGKILCILFPISAFVALGFEHSVANMYLVPIGMLAADGVIDWLALGRNLLPVTLGNVVGGASVAVVYWIVYLRAAGGNSASSRADRKDRA